MNQDDEASKDAPTTTADSLPTLQPFPSGNPEHPVRVRFHETESGLKCIFRGRMDASAALEAENDLRPKLEALEEEPKRVVYDLADVDYIASAFLRLCVMAVKATRGNFAIVNAKPETRKVLRIAGMESLTRGA